MTGRKILDLPTSLWQACGNVLYRLRVETDADQVILADGGRLSDRLNRLEREITSNTTTHVCADLAGRDAISRKISGDRAWVLDASADPRVAEGSALYVWLEPDGWFLQATHGLGLDAGQLAGAGLGTDGEGRLVVDLTSLEDETLLLALAGLLGDDFSLRDNRVVIDWKKLPEGQLAGILRTICGEGVTVGDDGLLRATGPDAEALERRLAELAGAGLKFADGQLALDNLPYAACGADFARDLAPDLAGSGLEVDGAGRLALALEDLTPERLASQCDVFAGGGLEVSRLSGKIHVDFTAMPEQTFYSLLSGCVHEEGPLRLEDGFLRLYFSDATDLKLSSVCATSKAVSLVSREARDAATNASEALTRLGVQETRLLALEAGHGELDARLEELDASAGDLAGELAALRDSQGEMAAELVEIGASLGNFSGADHGHELASAGGSGFMSAADKLKLDGVEAGAQVNPDLSGYATTEAMNTALAAKLDRGETLDSPLKVEGAFPNIILNSSHPNPPDDGSDWMHMLLFRHLNVNVANMSIFRIGGLPSFSFYLYLENRSKSFTFGLRESGGDYLRTIWLDSPPAQDNTGTAATTAWVRDRIAAATGKSATGFSLTAHDAEIMTLAVEGEDQPVEACAWLPDMISPDMIRAAHEAVRSFVRARIFGGFIYAIQGREYFFTYDLYDQQNLADAFNLSALCEKVEVHAMDMTDARHVTLELSRAGMAALYRHAVASHKGQWMRRGQEWRDAIDGATGGAALESVLEDLGLLEAYAAELAASGDAALPEGRECLTGARA